MDPEHYDIVLVGAGPIGLELAVAFKQLELNYLHLEAQQIAHTISWFAYQSRFFSLARTDRHQQCAPEYRRSIEGHPGGLPGQTVPGKLILLPKRNAGNAPSSQLDIGGVPTSPSEACRGHRRAISRSHCPGSIRPRWGNISAGFSP
ncbi:MAG: NAD(P)-binding domain-containing protein [Sedimentisphaerales bacterium]|nr:NAD(P)-binding domain-containing protein [Sedimentisphaerales bacterium]